MRMPLSRIAAYLLVAVAMVFTMVGLLPQSVRADEASGDEGVSTYALSDHTVQGVSPNGTTIDLFDYWATDSGPNNDGFDNNQGINAGHQLKFNTGAVQNRNDLINSWTGSGNGPRVGMVMRKLQNGYPSLAATTITGWANTGGSGTNGTQRISEESLSYLFDNTEVQGKAAYNDVQGLLQVDDDGYYYYNASSEAEGFDSANYAVFDPTTNAFTLYNTYAVNPTGTLSPVGQFFPFSDASDVFTGGRNELNRRNISSSNSVLNHYFGMHMSTQFVQTENGMTDGANGDRIPVTYEFSGDDDVWIYIDDVLVGDLGGIHDAARITIDFSTGQINVYDSNDRDVTPSNMRTIRDCYRAAGEDVESSVGWSGNTFADNTYHTLDFFYLERGYNDSNMSLKYNLVTIPETDIIKIDQNGEFISGVTFHVVDTTEGSATYGQTICTATTVDSRGGVTLLDNKKFPITIDQLWADGVKTIKLVEDSAPEGYRGTKEIPLYIWHLGGNETANGEEANLLLSKNPWGNGTYAQPRVTVTAANTINIEGRTSDGRTSITLDSLKDRGTLFVVIEKKEGNSWYPVTGNALDGWKVSSDSDIASAIKAGQSTNDIFTISTSGSYQAEVDELPGRIQDYVFFTSGSGTYRGSYYYTESDTLSGATSTNTYRVSNSDEFDRQFSAHLYVPNIVNRVLVQKTDETGAPVNGATIALYSEGSVTVEADTGVAKLNENAKPLETAETKTLSKENGDQIDLDGAAIFTKLESGVYWVGELASPDGYAKNTSLAKVIVDDTGVYADAGTDDDGVSVTRGVGRIVRSMVQFAVDDDVDATLHDIVATPQLGVESDGSIKWTENEDASLQHLSFSDTNDAVLDYDFEQGSEAYTVEEGIPRLTIKQCEDHKTTPRQEISEDITNLYTGVTIVRITNVHSGDFELSKTVNPAEVTDPFTFDLEFEQQLPTGGATGEAALSTATASYIKTLFPGDYKYTITKSGVTDPVEQGTLTIGEATASGENPGGDTSGEGSTEASAKYIITNVTDVELSGGAESHLTASAENGFYQVKLAHGETLTINGLPVYTQITATEVKPAGSYLTTVEVTPEVTVTEVIASDVEANVDAEGEGDSATADTETETSADGEDTADGTDGDNTDAATIEGLALDEEESAVTDGEQTTDAGEDGGADVSNETVAPQILATSVYTATTIIEKQVTGEGADAPVSYNASIAFTNTQSANATINVQKTLVGTYWMADKNAYEFTITASEETPKAPLPDPAKITIDAKSDDSFDEGSETEPVEPTSATVRVGSFGEIAFTGVKAGDSFEYEIKETHPTGSGNGWTYDGHTVKVTVTFEQDETTHELEAVVTYDNTAAATDDDKSVTDAAAFTNIYELTPAETESSLTGTKTLNRDFQ